MSGAGCTPHSACTSAWILPPTCPRLPASLRAAAAPTCAVALAAFALLLMLQRILPNALRARALRAATQPLPVERAAAAHCASNTLRVSKDRRPGNSGFPGPAGGPLALLPVQRTHVPVRVGPARVPGDLGV